MTSVKRTLAAALGVWAVGAAAYGQTGVEPAGWPPRRPAAVGPPVVAPQVCPPVAPPQVCPPVLIPAVPVPPGQPAAPAAPPAGQPPETAPPAAPPTPEAAAPTLPPGTDLLAEAPARGTGSAASALPNVNGDLLGGGTIAGPLPVVVAPNGQIVGPLPVVVLPDGRRIPIGGPPQVPTDELLRGRGLLTTAPPGSRLTALFPPPGGVFDESLAAAVARVPQIVRGSFKVAENDSPRPRTRAYFSYYFYDQVAKNFGGPNVPRVLVHQQVFGYEQAFLDDRASVGIRLPYNQLTSTFYSDTGLADITLTSKVTVWEDRPTGSLLSAGLLVTPPTGNRPFASTITGETIRGTLVQPFLGYIWRAADWYLQGFSSVVVPTDSRDVTLLTNGGQLGYILYRNPGSFLSAAIPTAELHVNTPLNHRGAQVDPVGFVDQVTLLGGSQFLIRERSGIGFSVGAPLTGPRPFSLQGTLQFNFWF